jgi:hypothetical protein
VARRKALIDVLLSVLVLAVGLQLLVPAAMAAIHTSEAGCHPTGCPLHHRHNLPQAPDGKCCILSHNRAAVTRAANELLPAPAGAVNGSEAVTLSKIGGSAVEGLHHNITAPPQITPVLRV